MNPPIPGDAIHCTDRAAALALLGSAIEPLPTGFSEGLPALAGHRVRESGQIVPA